MYTTYENYTVLYASFIRWEPRGFQAFHRPVNTRQQTNDLSSSLGFRMIDRAHLCPTENSLVARPACARHEEEALQRSQYFEQ